VQGMARHCDITHARPAIARHDNQSGRYPRLHCMLQRHLPWACLGDEGVVEYKMHDWTPLNLAIRITLISIDFAQRGSSGVVGQKSKSQKPLN
jgi:hypothetical protein